jgi:sortase A
MVDSVETRALRTPTPPRSVRLLGAVGRALITTGIVVLAFVGFQLWGTNISEARAQQDLREELDTTFTEARAQLSARDAGEPISRPTASPSPSPSPSPEVANVTLPGGFDPAVLEFLFPDDGDAVARIEIPAIGLDKIVVNGVQVVDLRKGPGQYPGTAPIGTEGNTAIAGHRTTYGAPFNRIDELQPGDEIRVTSVLGQFTYRVMTPEEAFPDRLDDIVSQGNGHIIVRPSATWVLDDFGDNRVTLTACHPKFSARRRIIVAAELVETPVVTPAIVAAIAGGARPESASEVFADSASEEVAGEQVTAPVERRLDVWTRTGTSVTLDEGLRGERNAIPGAIAWMVAAASIWITSGVIGKRRFERRTHRLAVRLVALVPAATLMWFSFEMIDRALPAA